MSKDMAAAQLERLEKWFTRLPINAETARILAHLDLDEGLERLTRRLGHRPDKGEIYTCWRVFSPQRFLQDRFRFPVSYIRVGVKYLGLRDSHPDVSVDRLWDEAALASKRPIPLSDGRSNHGHHVYGFNGRERFEALCAQLDGLIPDMRDEPCDHLECDPPIPSRPHPNGPDRRPAYLWTVRRLRALHTPEPALHRLALDTLRHACDPAKPVEPLTVLAPALGGLDILAGVAGRAATLAVLDGRRAIEPEHWTAANHATGLGYGVPDGMNGLRVWVERIRFASDHWASDTPPYGRLDLYDGNDYDDRLALADLDRELQRLDASTQTA